MLLQTNSYIVPRDKRVEHARLLRRFRQTLVRLGCDHFEVYEQAGPNWSSNDNSCRFVQIMRFRDRKHQLAVQNAERSDPMAQALLKEFCELINLQYQQQQGLFAVGFYTSFMRMPEIRNEVAGSLVQSDQSNSPQLEATTDSENSEMSAGASDETGSIEQSAEEQGGEESHEVEESGNGELAAEATDVAGHDSEGLESSFHSDEESDFDESGHPANMPRTENEQAENPTFPSNS